MYLKNYVMYRVISALFDACGGEIADAWIRHLEPVCVSRGRFVIHISDDAFRGRFAAQYGSVIRDALQSCFPEPLTLELWDDTRMARHLAQRENLGPFDPEFTLESFLVRQHNAAACRAAENFILEPSEVLLYLHGSPGSGKTHLLHAIAHGLYARDPAQPILLTNSDDFLTKYIYALRRGVGQVPEEFATASVLLVDDVHYLADKPTAAKELARILPMRIKAGRRTVLTGDGQWQTASPELDQIIRDFGKTVQIHTGQDGIAPWNWMATNRRKDDG